INAQFPKGQEYLKDFRNREKDRDLVPEARAGLESARNIAAQFNKSFTTLQTLAKSGNLEEAAILAASIKQMGVKAREEIKLITKSLGESSNIGSTRLGSQLGQTLGQISNVQKKTDRIISVNKLSLPNIDTVGVGKNTIDGMRQGMEKELEKLKATAEEIPNTVIDTVEKKLEIQSPSRWGIRVGRFVGEGFTKGLKFLEGGNNGIIPIFIKVMNDIKSAVENGEITSSAEDFKNRLSQGFSQGLGSVPGFKDAKQRFEGYKTFLKEIANPSTFAALGEGLANGIVAAKELFVDFLEIPGKLVEGFNQAKVAFDSFVEGMNKVQKFGEIMDFLKSSIGNVVKVLGLL
ncbi:MAG: hypothetical protein ACKPKT_19080, partial [Dolichospermum sp.]